MIKTLVRDPRIEFEYEYGQTELTQYADGRPSADRQWLECYAQLVGTVLSLWEASALDAAGGADVPATFINLADASIKMVWLLPFTLDNLSAPRMGFPNPSRL